ncbi:UNVERIFIED_CONTAM: hypothetical protein HDU68_008626 [Siphonaria sp. JEL0065]|nr:hypothetical protein HDU68_008626 [Siphonaria sp. JEL0065]
MIQESSTVAKYNPVSDNHGILEFQLLEPDTVWKISVPTDSETESKEFVFPVSYLDKLEEIESLLTDVFHHSLSFDNDGNGDLKRTTTVLDYYKILGLVQDNAPELKCPCLRFSIHKTGSIWKLSRSLDSLIAQPAIEASNFIQCTNELAALCSSKSFHTFLDPTPSGFIKEANQVAEHISTSLEVFNKVTSYSGNVVDALKKFNFDFGLLITGLECIANIGSMIPFVSSACSIITTVVDFVKKLEQNERNILFLKQHGSLLQQAIENRVKAYFSEGSNWIIDDQVCLTSYCHVLTESSKVLIHVVQAISQFDKRTLISKFLKNDTVDISDSQQRLDFSFKSILALDPIHIAVNLNSIVTVFHSPEGFEFWKTNRFGYSASIDRLLSSLSTVYKMPSTDEGKEIMRFQVLQHLRAQADGFIRVEDFGDWYSIKNMQAVLHQVGAGKQSDLSLLANSKDLDLLKRLDPASFQAEVQSFLNDHVVGSREWIFEHIESKIKSLQAFVIEAGPGFGKSMVSAAATKRWPGGLHYFFKIDDKRKRTVENFVKTLLFQLHEFLVLHSPSEADDMKSRVQSVLVDSKELDALVQVLVQFMISPKLPKAETNWLIIDALDECPDKDLATLYKLLEQFCHTSSRFKVLVTIRPKTLPSNIRARARQTFFNKPVNSERPQLGPRNDSGFHDSLSLEILSGLEGSQLNEDDLRVYFESTLRDASDRGIQVLLSKAMGCFLWAKLAVNVIRDLNEESHVTFVAHTVLNKDLGQLYTTSFNNSLTLPSFYQAGIKILMSLVLVAVVPLTMEEVEYLWIASWMRKEQEMKLSATGSEGAKWNDGSKIFSQCLLYARSRLMLRTDANGYVMAGHKSLRDYVDNNRLSRYVDSSSGHYTMAIICLELLENLSKELVIKLGAGLNANPGKQKGDELENMRLSLMTYASRFWFHHVKSLLKTTNVNQDRIATLNDGILHLFGSEKSIHWLAVLSSQYQLENAKEGLAFMSSHSLLPNICNGLRDVIDRFSDLLVTHPLEIYTSIAVFCLQRNSASKLFASVDRVLPSTYRPRVVLGTNQFWTLESSAVTTKIPRPVVALDALDSRKIVVGNRFDNEPRHCCVFEVWDLESNQVLYELELPQLSSYTTRMFSSATFKEDSETSQVVMGVFGREKGVYIWCGKEPVPYKLALDSAPRDIQTINFGSVSAVFVLLEAGVVRVDRSDQNQWVYQNIPLALGTSPKKRASKMKCKLVGNLLWMAVLVGSQLKLFCASVINENLNDFREVGTDWGVTGTVVDFVLGVHESFLLVGIVSETCLVYWSSATLQSRTISVLAAESKTPKSDEFYEKSLLERLNHVQIREGLMVAICNQKLVLLNTASIVPDLVLASANDSDWMTHHVSFIHHEGDCYVLFASGTESEKFDSIKQ